MKKIQHILRCYARPENDYIVGVCVDLNLAVRGDSIEAVKREMTQAIKGYLNSIQADGIKDFVPRPAPAYIWLQYYLVCCVVLLSRFVQSCKKTFQVFNEEVTPKGFAVNLCV